MQHLLYIRMYLINILQERYTKELKKIRRPELEDPWLVPFNPDAAYALGESTPYGRYVKVSIVFH
jgi:hypothetical protein